MRIALLTLEASAAACAVRQFVAESVDEIVLVGLSDPFAGRRGGSFRQLIGTLRHSGPRFLPYLVANFVVPRLSGEVWRLLRWRVDVAGRPLAHACRRRGIACLAVRDVNGAEWLAALRRSGADLVVSFHFDQIMTAATLSATPRGGVNVHAGLLPRHRGPVPTLHALLDDTPALGVTVHRLAARIDAGAILAQAALAWPGPRVSALAAARLLHLRSVALLHQVMAALRVGEVEGSLPEVLPYRGFPTSAQLRCLARLRRGAANWSDFLAAARTPV